MTLFPGGSDCKESACNVGDPVSVCGSGRSPGEGNGNPLQYSCLKNPIDGGTWWARVHRVTKSQTWMSNLLTLYTMHSCVTCEIINWVFFFFQFPSSLFYIFQRVSLSPPWLSLFLGIILFAVILISIYLSLYMYFCFLFLVVHYWCIGTQQISVYQSCSLKLSWTHLLVLIIWRWKL